MTDSDPIFKKIEKKIKHVLGDTEIFHKGSSNLRISGQNEIDIYIPIDWKNFESYSTKLEKIFGEPRSVYDQKRARFVSSEDKIKLEIFLIHNTSEDWQNLLKFENTLLSNKILLGEYEEIKNKSQGLSTRKYYSLKLEFINKVLAEE